MRSAPTITRSTSPRAIRAAALESVTTRKGTPACRSSQAVSLAPCSSGRVSPTHTWSTRPERQAASMEPPAVPAPAVASPPVLQCVYTRLPGANSRSACAAMRLSASACSRATPSAQSTSAKPGSEPSASARPSASRARAIAHARFTAVGLVEPSSAATSSKREEGSAESRSPSASPYAAATPIAGAPRTARRRIASATSSGRSQRSHTSSSGRRVWSSSSSTPPPKRSGTATSVEHEADGDGGYAALLGDQKHGDGPAGVELTHVTGARSRDRLAADVSHLLLHDRLERAHAHAALRLLGAPLRGDPGDLAVALEGDRDRVRVEELC